MFLGSLNVNNQKTWYVPIFPIYYAANWKLVGKTRGYQRIRSGYSNTRQAAKLVFVQPLQRNARLVLSGSPLPQRYVAGTPRMKLTAEQIWSLPDFFKLIQDPRRAQGRRLRSMLCLPSPPGCLSAVCAAIRQSPTGRRPYLPRLVPDLAVTTVKEKTASPLITISELSVPTFLVVYGAYQPEVRR